MTRHSARCWALPLGVLLAAALLLMVPIRPPAYSLAPIYSFDANAVGPISFIEDGTSAVTPQPGPSARKDEQAAPLFGMDAEPLFGGDILEKWNRAKAEIAQELETVARCRAGAGRTTLSVSK
jgi:hypothetical protein